MLKSRFNLAEQEVEEEQPEEKVEEAGYEAVVEEEAIVYPERKLKRSEVSVRLSLLGLTAEGDGYTYLKAVCTGMSLTIITAIKCFKHLQFLDVSNNYLDLEALQAITALPYLVLIQADKNVLHSAALKRMEYLQVMILNVNKLSSIHDIYQPELCTLEAGYNRIQRIFFLNRMPQIKCLDFRYNFIKDISELDFPNLDSLYLAGNKISSLEGISRPVNLRILHLRFNPIKLLDGFDEGLKRLQYINLRNCKVKTLRQIKKLRILPALDTLILKGCPYMGGTGTEDQDGAQEDDPEIRVEALAALPKLKRLNKGVVTPEERSEAKELMAQWQEEGEKIEEEEAEAEHQEEVFTE